MNPLYSLNGIAGRDLYDHNNRVVGVGTDILHDEATARERMEAYISHCKKRLQSKEYSWAEVVILEHKGDGTFTTFAHWHQALPIKEKIKLNEQAKDAPRPKQIATIDGLPLFATATTHTADVVVPTPANFWYAEPVAIHEDEEQE